MNPSWMAELTPMNMILIAGIIWLSGVFIWLIKKFVCSYQENTKTMTKVQDTLEVVDRKLDAASTRDVEIVRTLAAIHARQAPPYVHPVPKSDSK